MSHEAPIPGQTGELGRAPKDAGLGKEALDQALALLEALDALRPETNSANVASLKSAIRSQLIDLARELAVPGESGVLHVKQLFESLLGKQILPEPSSANSPSGITDPGQLGGTFGQLRDALELNRAPENFVNSVEDEQNLSNFRTLSDFLNSLFRSWLSKLNLFGSGTNTSSTKRDVEPRSCG